MIISTVHIAKALTVREVTLDSIETSRISAFLFHTGPDDDPQRLTASKGLCFQGNIVLGTGFTFDDSEAGATPIAEVERLLKRPQNISRIKPFIGGREINDSPRHEFYRYVIDFEELSEAEASQWPELLSILQLKVRPERSVKDAKKYPRMVHEWWKFWNRRSELYKATKNLERVLVTSLVTKHFNFCFIPASWIVSHKLAAFSLDRFAAFGVIQSSVHDLWARMFSSSHGDGLNYSPSDCFETFPFPENWQQSLTLEQIGERYYTFRADLMVRNNEGLTTTYNRFHDPDERSPDIFKLRELHADMDHAVLTAYGWTDLAERATCEFRLDYEDDAEPDADEAPRARAKKKPWRYRWPQDFHDEVLARLLDLNQQRAEQERLAATSSSSPKTKPAKKASKSASKKAAKAIQPSLLPPDDE